MGDIFSTKTDPQTGLCPLEVQVGADTMPLILGDTFLRTIIPIFDAERLRIGLAQRKDHQAPSEQTVQKMIRDRSQPRRSYVPQVIEPSMMTNLECWVEREEGSILFFFETWIGSFLAVLAVMSLWQRYQRCRRS